MAAVLSLSGGWQKLVRLQISDLCPSRLTAGASPSAQTNNSGECRTQFCSSIIDESDSESETITKFKK